MESGRRRTFNSDEKRELYLRARGRCSICRVRLAEDWHADHVTPYVAGGETVLENGQALCSKCNLKKSCQMPEQVRRMNEPERSPDPIAYVWDRGDKSEYFRNPYPPKFHQMGCIGEETNLVCERPNGYQEKSARIYLAFGFEVEVWERDYQNPGEWRPPEFAVRIQFRPRFERMVFCETLSDLLQIFSEIRGLEKEQP